MRSQGQGVPVSRAQRTGCMVRDTRGGCPQRTSYSSGCAQQGDTLGEALSGSGGLLGGACTRLDNGTFANSLTTATQGRAVGLGARRPEGK